MNIDWQKDNTWKTTFDPINKTMVASGSDDDQETKSAASNHVGKCLIDTSLFNDL
jgi:hypothetical protein